MDSHFPTDHDMVGARLDFRELMIPHWVHDDLWSLNWWLLLIVMIASWYIWWKFLDKQRLLELLLYGSFSGIIASILDELGTSWVLWVYEDSLMPIFTPLFIFDLVQVPVAFTLIYQHFPRWKSYLLMIISLSAIFAYVMEPLLIRLHIYQLITWKHAYSFVIYIFIGIFLKWVMHRIMGYQHRSSPH